MWPSKSQSQSSCCLFLSRTPLEDHRCLGHRPELEPAHSTLLLLTGYTASGGWSSLLPSFLPHLPWLLSPPAIPTTGLSPIFQQFWGLFPRPGICTPPGRLLLLLQGAAQLRNYCWPSPPSWQLQDSDLWVPNGICVVAFITQHGVTYGRLHETCSLQTMAFVSLPFARRTAARLNIHSRYANLPSSLTAHHVCQHATREPCREATSVLTEQPWWGCEYPIRCTESPPERGVH